MRLASCILILLALSGCGSCLDPFNHLSDCGLPNYFPFERADGPGVAPSAQAAMCTVIDKPSSVI